jgi:hypothetical protein
VQEALRANGIEYEKVIAAHGHPIPFLRKGSRDALRDATGDTKLPALKLPDGTIITHSRAPNSAIRRASRPGNRKDARQPPGASSLPGYRRIARLKHAVRSPTVRPVSPVLVTSHQPAS